MHLRFVSKCGRKIAHTLGSKGEAVSRRLMLFAHFDSHLSVYEK